jgi:hypothetical protein
LRHGTLSNLPQLIEILSCPTQFNTQSEHYFSNTEMGSNTQLQNDCKYKEAKLIRPFTIQYRVFLEKLAAA